MRFLTALFKGCGGALGGALCGLVAVLSVRCCGHLVGLDTLSATQWWLVFGGFVVWGMVQPRRFLILLFPVLMAIDVSGSSVGWSGGWRSAVIGSAMLAGAALLAVGWFLQHEFLGRAGTVLFWLPFALQFVSRQPRREESA